MGEFREHFTQNNCSTTWSVFGAMTPTHKGWFVWICEVERFQTISLRILERLGGTPRMFVIQEESQRKLFMTTNISNHISGAPISTRDYGLQDNSLTSCCSGPVRADGCQYVPGGPIPSPQLNKASAIFPGLLWGPTYPPVGELNCSRGPRLHPQ